MTRKGKIARLPRSIRDQLNRRIEDGEPQNNLVKWLNSLPEVRAVIQAEFIGRPITEQNLSEWKGGGFRDWQFQQQAIELVQHMDADAAEMSQASKTRLPDLLAHRLAARYVVAARTLIQPNAEGEVDLKLLRDFCSDIIALRKGDHSAERLKLERERLELEREQLRKVREEELWAWAQEHRDEICKGYTTNAEKIAMLRRAFFGDVDKMEASGEVKLPECACTAPAAPSQSDPIRPNPTSEVGS